MTIASVAGGLPLVTQPRRVALLTYLLIARPRGMHSRDTLLAMFWPDASEESARHALRNALHGLRRELGDGAIVSSGVNLIGVDRAVFVCDVLQAESDLEGGKGLDVVLRSEAELMSGFHVSNAPAFEHWLDAERQRMRRLLLTTAWTLVAKLRADGSADKALLVAQRARQLAPDHEPTIRHVIEILAESGERAAALQEYDAFAARLASEYDVRPGAETNALMRRVSQLPTRDAEAYVLYVRGTFLFLRGAHGGYPDELERSRSFFERALARDPAFAPALAGLSNYYSVAATRELLEPWDEHFAHAIELSHRALSIDPMLAIPHIHFGVKALYIDHDWELARAEFTHAIQIDPLYAEGHRFLGVLSMALGDHATGLRELRAAAMLEPEIAIYHNSLGAGLMTAGRIEEAIHVLSTAVQLDPQYKAARERLLRCYEARCRYSDAVAERRRGAMANAEDFATAFEARGAAGYRAQRQAELRSYIALAEARLTPPGPRRPSELMNPPEVPLAMACAELGDRERARVWEEKACGANPGVRPWFDVQPLLRP